MHAEDGMSTGSDEKDRKYLNLSQDLDDLRFGFGAKEKTVAGLKLFGKSLFNVAKFTVTEALPEMNKRMEEEIKKKGKR
jgi:hypothetical protein